jgi:formiminotetrahydrofolate cyclodeaminase
MVSGLTLGRKKYEAVQELALRAQAQADVLRKRLLAAMEQDTQAFLQVSAAYAMPKQTLEEKQARSSAIEQGLKACTQPPLAVMQLCAEGLELLERLLGKTNATAASDFGVACLSLRAGLQGAWLNVCINTGSLCDAAFAADARAAGQKLLDAGLPRAERCYAAMLGACSEE